MYSLVIFLHQPEGIRKDEKPTLVFYNLSKNFQLYKYNKKI
jgi:hypothetical protein